MIKGCAMICDIKKSKRIRNWSTYLKGLGETLKEINRKFSDDILVNFALTVGDEFQGVLLDSRNAYIIYSAIKYRLSCNFYCGFGIGNVEIPTKNSTMRGTAFYRARDVLGLCKKKKRGIIIKSSDNSNQTDETINTLLHLVEVIENSWTKRQREVIVYFKQNPNYSQKRLGKHFGVTKQTVGKHLVSANWNAFSHGERMINTLLERLQLSRKSKDI